MQRVFISYSHRDKVFAERLVRDLKMRGLDVWWDDHRLKVGDSILDAVTHGIECADYLVTVLSPDSIRSQWASEELKQAEASRRSGSRRPKILPILLRDCEVPGFLTDRLYADFRNPAMYDEAFRLLMKVFAVENADAFAQNEAHFLHALRLPHFYAGQELTALQVLRIQQAISVIQAALGIQVTAVEPFSPGEELKAASLNELTEPLASLRLQIGLRTQFQRFPVQPEDVLTAETLNELVDYLNEACEHVAGRHQRADES